jgi:hypothetical protein
MIPLFERAKTFHALHRARYDRQRQSWRVSKIHFFSPLHVGIPAAPSAADLLKKEMENTFNNIPYVTDMHVTAYE